MIYILAFRSNPADQPLLRLDEEIRQINHAIAPAAKRDFLLENVGAVRLSDLPTYLLSRTPDILHFSGHGSRKGHLIFEDERGDSKPVNNQTIKFIFQELGAGIKCVVLSSCYSQQQAREIYKYVPYVLGNTKDIKDELSIQFSATFYQCLSYGKTIEESFNVARAIISSSNPKNSKIPMLYNNKILSEADQSLFKYPVVMAQFVLDDDDDPYEDNEHYEIEFWVENLPESASSVLYHFNHESIPGKLAFEEMKNDGSGVETSRSLFGNIQVKVTIWFAKEGTGLVTTVYDALARYYSMFPPIPSAIKKA